MAFAAEEGSKAFALAITEFRGALLKGDSLRPVALTAAFAMALIHADAWAQTDKAKVTASALAKLAQR